MILPDRVIRHDSNESLEISAGVMTRALMHVLEQKIHITQSV